MFNICLTVGDIIEPIKNVRDIDVCPAMSIEDGKKVDRRV